ncbi:unnamed protein product [Vicia faba]|uniref:Uncharacterized protein n=1 Tax=Vicia faba TaxID=3906 RepID=A0AAV0ZCC4_VICFA|nr:unnamed protein product [Vicia faba]
MVVPADDLLQQAVITTRRRGCGRVSWEEVEGTSTSAPRSFLSRGSLSRDYEDEEPEWVQVPEHEWVQVPEPERVQAPEPERVQVPEPEMIDVLEVEEETIPSFSRGPSDTSLLIYYTDHVA